MDTAGNLCKTKEDGSASEHQHTEDNEQKTRDSLLEKSIKTGVKILRTHA